ncbi:unnamed protein product [Pedinophyceae sp. YPF-701]|nr:unnamed protein product [Pedinophyceae sp. YPF-701]
MQGDDGAPAGRHAPFSGLTSKAQETQEEVLARFEQRRAEREVVVPTRNEDVVALLRKLGEPITLFGERELERRTRLRSLLARLDDTALDEATGRAQREGAVLGQKVDVQKEVFFTRAPGPVKEVRTWLADWSLERAMRRVEAQQALGDEGWAALDARREAVEARLRDMSNELSEMADDRPVSSCQCSSGGARLVTGSWNGTMRVWSMPDMKQQRAIHAHDDRITGVAVHPQADDGQQEGGVHYLSASADSTAKLWDAEGRLLHTLSGHTDRLARCAFHPSGLCAATASFDATWRLWDTPTGTLLYEQEGHSEAVYDVAFHPDGSLAISVGLDAGCRVWDLRTGRSVLALEGHVQGVLSASFAPNGYQVATGSSDHSVRVWDLRKKACEANIPAHTSLVSAVRFAPDGDFLLTASFDRTARVWSARDFTLTGVLRAHEAKVMAAEVCAGRDPVVVTCSYDRQVKLWRCPPEDSNGDAHMA